MIDHDAADRRIEHLERELARAQAEETTPLQIEASFAREKLGATLSTAATIAVIVLRLLDRAADEFDRTHHGMEDELNGRVR